MTNISCPAFFLIKSYEGLGTFSGYASVFDELDTQGAFPKMLWQHDASEPIGVWEEIREDERGLFVRGRLVLELKRAQEAYALMKARVLDSLSIGYRVMRASRGQAAKERCLTELELLEISLVTFPANRAAKIINLKAREEKNDEHLIQTLKRAACLLRT